MSSPETTFPGRSPAARGGAATAPGGGTVQVYVLGDGDIARYGICSRLRAMPGIGVAGDGRAGVAALEQVREQRPDVVVVAARLADGDVITCARELRSADPALRTLLLTSCEPPEATLTAIFVGACAHVYTGAGGRVRAAEVRGAAAGQRMLEGRRLREPLESMRSGRLGVRLSVLEDELLEFMIRGMTDVEIAYCLNLDARLVSRQIGVILAKLPG